MGQQALFHRDDGMRDLPGQDSSWDEWVSASKTRNVCLDDPLLDWLDAHGETKGFHKDTDGEAYDPRTDFLKFVFQKGREFEAAVLGHLEKTLHLVRIAASPADIRTSATATRTWDAMASGMDAIAQAVLWNPQTRSYGAADLLVRSDVLARLFPKELDMEEAARPAPDLPGARWHYRVVDVKFTTLDLLKDGHAGSDHAHYMAQVWIYNAALGRIQGFTPPCGYLLGRGWNQGKERGDSALDRIARVEQGCSIGRERVLLADLVHDACTWVRRVRSAGASWQVLPEPSVEELRPNMRNSDDTPWHGAKQRIAAELHDLTLLPRVTPKHRSSAMTAGVHRWTDTACTADVLGITGDKLGPLLDAVIEANHSPADGQILFPPRVTADEDLWRSPSPVEFFVDFETVNDLDDNFSAFPRKGGQPMMFMIGCGHLATQGDLASWSFKVFTAELLTQDQERSVITEWLTHVDLVCKQRGARLQDSRFFHWSPAETSNLSTAYNSAVARHGVPAWDSLPWVDLLNRVVKPQPVTIRGAFGFGLKAVAKAMHAAGKITTLWGDGPTDGMGAMAGAWWCHHEAARQQVSMRALDLMRSIETYNEVDCKVMAEVLDFFRNHR